MNNFILALQIAVSDTDVSFQTGFSACLRGKEGNSGGARKAGYTAMLCTKSINVVHKNLIQHLRADCPAGEAPRTVMGTASVHR
jgi:hypothetical protein